MAASQPLVKRILPKINWGNPLTKNLVFDAGIWENAGPNTTDLVKKMQNAFTSTPTWATGFSGTGIKFAGGSSQYTKSTTKVSTVVDNFSMECLFIPTATSGEQLVFYNGNDAGGWGIGTNGSTMEVLYGGATRQISGAGNGTATNGVLYDLILVREAGTSKLYNNGLDTGLSFPNAPAAIPSTSFTTIGDELDSGNNPVAGRGFTGLVFAARIWERPLTLTEIRQEYVNPWQIYVKPNFNPFYVSPATVAAVYAATRMMMGMGF